MKRRLTKAAGIALLSGTLVAGFSAPAFATTKTPTIGFTVYSMTSWVSWGKQGALKVAKADHVHLLWRSARSDVATQISQIQQFINEHVNLIIVAAVNSATLGPQLKAAKRAGIPVVATNMLINAPNNKYLKSYVGPNDVGAGVQTAQNVVNALNGKGNVVVLQGPIGQSAELQRTEGIKQVLKKHPGIKLLAMQPGNWNRTTAYSLMQDWLSRYGSKVNGVIAENDDMAIGAIRALKAKGLAGKIPVAGSDGIKDGMREIKAGNEIETNLQDAAIELGEAVQVGVDYLHHKPYPKEALLNLPEITKKNVNHYYNQLYVHPQQFLNKLPSLVKQDLKSGKYANQ